MAQEEMKAVINNHKKAWMKIRFGGQFIELMHRDENQQLLQNVIDELEGYLNNDVDFIFNNVSLKNKLINFRNELIQNSLIHKGD